MPFLIICYLVLLRSNLSEFPTGNGRFQNQAQSRNDSLHMRLT